MTLMQPLEPRRLFAAFALHVNFQPAGAAVPAGYLADTGAVYANRGNGFTYGWNVDASAAARDRNSPKALDQRYDTFIHTQAFGTRTWEASVPNGTYSVHIMAGDPSFYDSVIKFNAEGVLLVSGTPSSGGPFVEGRETVTVSDGKLTISNAAGASNNKICFIDISSDIPPPTGFGAKINFQPAGATIPAGYVPDTGLAFGSRGNGLTYGWSAANTVNTRDRNAANSPDQRYDTLDHFKSLSWDLAVPSGQYSVHVVVGDPSFTDSVYGLNAEGVKIVGGTPTSQTHWFENTTVVTVTDGRLTLTNAAGSSNNRICYIEVTAIAGEQQPIIKVTAPDPNGMEGIPGLKDFIFTRSGDVSKSLAVNIAVSGTATNNRDYDIIGPTVTFAAGSETSLKRVAITNDSEAEPTETVVVTIQPGNGYAVGSPFSATINIADNDSTGTGTTIAWKTGKSSPISRSEAMTATIDGKMYVLGGYSNGVFTPTNRVDVYDPAADTWTRLENSNMPVGTSHSGCTVLGRSIVIAGGYPVGANNSGQTFSTTGVWSLNVDTGVWTTLPSLPAARGGGALVNLDGVLHFFGGADSARKDANTHWQLLPGASSWTALASLPTNRNHMGAVVLAGKIYAVGGQQNQDAAEIPQAAVEIYDSATNQWSAGKSLPFGRSHVAGATVLVNGRIVVLGGETTFNSTVKTVSAYDPGVNDWLPMTDLPVSINSGVAAYINGELIYTTGRFATATYRGTIS